MVTVSAPPALVHMRAAVEFERAGRLDEAAERYTQVLEARPESLRAWVNLGNVEAGRGRPQEAERAYRRALSVSPDDPDALNNLAWLLLQEGSRLEEAEAFAHGAALRPGPDQGLILDTLARIQSARGRCTDADATYAEALALPALPQGNGHSWRRRVGKPTGAATLFCDDPRGAPYPTDGRPLGRRRPFHGRQKALQRPKR